MNTPSRLLRSAALLLGMALCQTPAALAQTAPQANTQALALPLSSVGREVGWFKRNGGDLYRLAVFERAADQPLGVELYSPEINLGDYANKRNVQNYYGDEIYGPNVQMRSDFTLSGREGGSLAARRYGNGQTHSFDALFRGPLAQGYYPVGVNTFGNGKNAFSFRLTPGIAVESSQFTVVTRGQFGRNQLAARLTFGRAAVGKTFELENFDADGPREMEIFVRLPNGQTRRLTPSGDVQWAADRFTITPDLLGEWAILVRILPTTTQFSNSVTFRLKLGGEPYWARMASSAAPALPRVAPPAPPAPPQVDVAVTKSVSKAQANLGERVAYTLTVTNNGPDAATGVVLTDTLPAGLAFATAEGAQVAGNTVTWSVGDLARGQSRAYTVGATAVAAGRLVNSASVRASEAETTTANNQAAAPLEVVQPAATPVPTRAPEVDVAVTKTVAPARVNVGEAAAYTLTVTNNGPDAATGVVLTDTLPAGLAFVSAAPTAAVSGQTLSWSIGSLPRGERRSFTVQVRATAAGTLVNRASVSAAEPEANTANNRASAPLEAVVPPPAFGNLNVGAAALVCGARQPLSAQFDLAGRGRATPALLSLEAGRYTLTPAPLAGATAQPLSVTVTSGASQDVTLEYRVALSLSLQPQTLSLRLGERATLTATASTAYGQPVPARIRMVLPEGLEAAGPVRLEGQVSAGRPLTLSVPVRATRVLNGAAARAELEGCDLAQGAALGVAANPLPDLERESRVLLMAKLGQLPSGLLILSDRIPAGATYVPGSSARVRNPRAEFGALEQNNTWLIPTNPAADPLPEPLQRGDRLYWTLPALTNQDTYALTYRLAHRAPIEMPADRLGVVLGLPQARSAETGEPRRAPGLLTQPQSLGDNPVARALGLGELRLLQGSPEVLQGLLQALPLGVLNEPARVEVGGPAARIVLSPVRLADDATRQPALLVQALDKDGKAASDPFVTLEVSPEPAGPDAAPETPGFQARLEKGQALVRLTDLAGAAGADTAPALVTAQARIGAVSSSTRFSVSEPSVAELAPQAFSVGNSPRGWVIVGAAGAQLSAPDFGVGVSAQAFARGELGGGLTLTAAFNTGYDTRAGNFLPADLLPPANPFERFPLLGDSSRLGSDVRSSDAVYFRLSRGDDYLMYGQMTPGFQGLLTRFDPAYNGLRAELREGGLSLRGFAALAPNADRLEFFRGDGTAFYRLSGANTSAASPTVSGAASPEVEPRSEQLRVAVYDRANPALLLSERPLERLADYSLDYLTGNILLTRPLASADPDGNPQFLRVEYALSGAAPAIGDLRYGVQAGYDFGGFSVGASYLRFNPLREAQLGLSAGLQAGGLRVAGELATSGLPGQGNAAGSLQASYADERLEFSARYQDVGNAFVDPNLNQAPALPGRDAQAGVAFRLTPSLKLTGRYSLNQSYAQGGDLDQAYSLEARNDFGSLSAALGLAGTLGDDSGVPDKLWLTAGAEARFSPFTVGLTQKVGLGLTNGETVLSLDYALSPNFGLRYAQSLVYVDALARVDGRGTLGVRGSFSNLELIQTLTGNTPDTAAPLGSTNIAATYDLPTADGPAGRARVGLDTNIPLGRELSAQLAGEVVAAPAGQGLGAVSAGLAYSAEGAKASARAQFSLSGAGLKQLYTAAGVFQLSPEWVVSPAAEYGVLADGTSGGRFGLAAAHRGDDWSLLTNNRYRTGALYAPGGDELEGELRASYQASETLFVRGGLAYKLAGGSFTGQAGAGATVYVTDFVGLGGNVAYLFQPATGTGQLAFGLEGSLRFAPGLALGAGFNFVGFQGLGGLPTAPGFYLRLDWKFDERTFGLGGR